MMTTTQTNKKRINSSSIIAKCTAPFTSKQSNQLEQEIRLHEPFRQYCPGDIVKGAVHLSFAKPLRITHLVLRLHGFVKVISRAKLPGEEIKYDEKLFAVGRGRGRRGTEYFGDGFAQLFEEENVLCGEGRVLGQYEFQFEMVLPSRGLPSSIDFEHGTIAYLLSSTVTRPTTIVPTSTVHRKLNVQETIDIAPIPRPMPQMLSLEAYHKRRKPRMGSRKKEKSSLDSANSTQSPTSTSPSPHTEEDPPRSPVPSEISSASATGSSISSNPISSRTPHGGNSTGTNQDTNASPYQDTTYAKTEVLQGGCLPGDPLPIRIEIHHTKPIKSMQGVIITLFRQGRIDTQPPMPLGPVRKGEKPKYEDYYPKSRTGLGGLSLSAAGSSRSFRQDLNQVFAPIIIDPQSLTQVINTSIQAPFDLFPTISCVPGAMITFNYFVEIVMDLRGKVGSQDRILDHLSVTNVPQHGYGDPRISKYEGIEGVSYLSTPGFNYLITDQLRRTKGVIFTRTKIIVGTRDSARRRGKKREDRSLLDSSRSLGPSIELGREVEPKETMIDHEERLSLVQDEQIDGTNYLSTHRAVSIPPPTVEDSLDEKARMKRAEQNLLPSAPPHDGDPSPTLLPSAPPAIDEEDFNRRYGFSVPAYDGPSTAVQHIPNGNQQSHNHDHSASGPQDDKLELERWRLLALASSPDDDNEEDDVSSVPESHPQRPQPSAPILYQDDIFDINDPRIPQPTTDDFTNTDDDHDIHTDMDNSHERDNAYEPNPSHHHGLDDTENLPVYIR